MKLEFRPVNLEKHLQQSIKFRQDTWLVSYGNLDGYSEKDTINWFEKLAVSNPSGFLHIWLDDALIGQLEFNCQLLDDKQKPFVYINLFYLIDAYRGKNAANLIHEYVMQQAATNQCEYALLRYIPGNIRAKKFYLKHAWNKVGEVDPMRGQLMRRELQTSFS